MSVVERVVLPEPEPPERGMWGTYIGAPAYFIDGKMFAHTVGPTTEHVLVYLHEDGAREIVAEFVAPSLAVARYLILEEAAAYLEDEEPQGGITVSGRPLGVILAIVGLAIGLLFILIAGWLR